MATKDLQKRIKFEEGWPVLQEAVDKVIRISEGVDEVQGFTSEEYMRSFTIVYEMVRPMPDKDHCQELYDQYKNIFEEYITCVAILTRNGRRSFVTRISTKMVKLQNNDKMAFKNFRYIDRFLPKRSRPSLEETSFISFYDLVYGEMNNQVRDVMISVIDRERDGDQIDQALVKNVLAIYVEIGKGSMKFYNKDFEEAMLEDTAAFYSKRASDWIRSESYEDYMLKVNNLLKT